MTHPNPTNVQLTDNSPKTGQLPLHSSTPLSEDLFDRPDSWLSEPDKTFSAWVSHLDVSKSTKTVWISMWGKFVRWLNAQVIPLDECRAHHIKQFLAKSELDKEHAWRYVKLIDRVYAYLIAQGLDMPNPGQIAGKEGIGNRVNDPPRFLDPWEREDLTQVIREIIASAQGAEAMERFKAQKKVAQKKAWAELRDAAMAALILGGGIKTSELGDLSIKNQYQNGEMEITGEYGEHRAKLFPIAVEALDVWLPYRLLEPNLGDVLFPAMIGQRRSDRLTATAGMHPVNIFRRMRNIFRRAKLTGTRTSGQTLRNTYAAQLIDAGFDDESIIEAMGFKKEGTHTVPKLRYEYGKECGIEAENQS